MTFDVIIAGAGPAGATCARICARQGLRTLLLDKDVFPRFKPCAGAVSSLALSYLDFALPDDLIEKECFGVRVHYDGRDAVVRRNDRFGVLVNRRDFDFLLANKASEGGARFNMGEQVVAVLDRRDFVEVTTASSAYRTRFLVGADGVLSRTARTLRPPLARDEMALALVSPAPADDRAIARRLDTDLDLYFGLAPMGYGWLFPHRGCYSAGVAGQASSFLQPKDSLAKMAEALEIGLEDVKGHFIPFGGIRRPAAKERILLAGDAAGFADPFHGEGISHAILSGRLAAEAIVDAVSNGRNPSAAAARYQRETDRKIRRQLRVALRMARALERYPGIFMRLFLDHSEALLRYLDIPAGRIDYRQFQRWLLLRLPLLLFPRAARRQPQGQRRNS